VRQRWFSRRAITLHLAVLVFVPGCLIAWWWQVNRAMGGNGLSYLYAVEWPVFAIVGVYFWWSLLHIDPEQVGARAQRRAEAEARQAAAAGPAAVTEPAAGGAAAPTPRHLEDEDPELAAYNEHLAALAARGPKTWRHS
jgi:hypothetical protein